MAQILTPQDIEELKSKGLNEDQIKAVIEKIRLPEAPTPTTEEETLESLLKERIKVRGRTRTEIVDRILDIYEAQQIANALGIKRDRDGDLTQTVKQAVKSALASLEPRIRSIEEKLAQKEQEERDQKLIKAAQEPLLKEIETLKARNKALEEKLAELLKPEEEEKGSLSPEERQLFEDIRDKLAQLSPEQRESWLDQFVREAEAVEEKRNKLRTVFKSFFPGMFPSESPPEPPVTVEKTPEGKIDWQSEMWKEIKHFLRKGGKILDQWLPTKTSTTQPTPSEEILKLPPKPQPKTEKKESPAELVQRKEEPKPPAKKEEKESKPEKEGVKTVPSSDRTKPGTPRKGEGEEERPSKPSK